MSFVLVLAITSFSPAESWPKNQGVIRRPAGFHGQKADQDDKHRPSFLSLRNGGQERSNDELTHRQHSNSNEPLEVRKDFKTKPKGFRRKCIARYLKKDALQLSNQHDIRRFVFAAYDHDDSTQIISMLGSEEGLVLLKELVRWPMSPSAGNRATVLSFQHIILPLLRLLTGEDFRTSMLSTFLNQIFSILHHDATFNHELVSCLELLTCQASIEDRFLNPATKDPNCWSPVTWVDAFQPVVRYFLEIINRFRDSQCSSSLLSMLEKLQSLADQWTRIDPHPPQLATLLHDLDLALQIMNHTLSALAAASHSGLQDLLFPGRVACSSRPAAALRVGEGPGALGPGGVPRHSNDDARIARIRVAPTADEVLSSQQPFLPCNDAAAPHHLDGVGRLLDVHFRLLREDFVWALRRGVSAFWHAWIADGEDLMQALRTFRFDLGGREFMFVFPEVRVLDVSAERRRVEFVLNFRELDCNMGMPQQQRKNFWEKTRRLTIGCLVCLCWKDANGNSDLAFATVSGRDESDLAPQYDQGFVRPRVRISTQCSGNASVEKLVELIQTFSRPVRAVLLQASDSYFSYEPILTALQKIDEASFPLAKYLVHNRAFSELISPPAYLNEQVALNLTTLLPSRCNFSQIERLFLQTVRMLDPDSSKFALQLLREHSSLDEAQLLAAEAALTKEIVLIQGPPGTGKSFLGIKLVQVLLNIDGQRTTRGAPRVSRQDTHNESSRSTPILCICYTNHALDNFLEGLLANGISSLVRVGERSRSDKLKPYMLGELNEPSLSQQVVDRRFKEKIFALRKEIESTCRALYDPSYINRFEQTVDLMLPGFLESLGLMTDSRFKAKGLQPNIFMQWKQGQCRVVACQAHRQRMWGNEISLERLKSDNDTNIDSVSIRGRILYEFAKYPSEGIHISQFDLRFGSNFRESCLKCFECTNLSQFFRNMSDIVKIQNDSLYLNNRIKLRAKVLLRACNGIPTGEAVLVDASSQHAAGRLVVWYNYRPVEIDANAAAPMHTTNRSLDQLVKAARFPWHFSLSERKLVCKRVHGQMQATRKLDFQKSIDDFEKAQKSRQEVWDQSALEVMRKHDVVGMTTSGAGKYQHILEKLAARVVIVEEAAEVLEAHILAALSPSTKHLILIGDHYQLRPKTQAYELSVQSGRGYNLDISLFERLVDAGLPCYTLGTQHRMRPSISKLLRKTLYPHLKDSELVQSYPRVRGVVQDLFFFDHNNLENDEGDESSSKWNTFEVEMVVQFSMYLIRQGYRPNEITILTPYLGQLFKIRERLSAFTMVFVNERDMDEIHKTEESMPDNLLPDNHTVDCVKDRVRLATVDNFQGEESEVVILSLVRNNKHGQIGFLKLPNRINVMLSRAKHGLYIFGHAESLEGEQNSPMWAFILQMLRSNGHLGKTLLLQCPNHPQTVSNISNPKDFQTMVGDGGCSLQCEFRLPCGHVCPRRCHPDDKSHITAFCTRPCERLRDIAVCPDRHPCPLPCGNSCGPCRILVKNVSLECGHMARNIECQLVQEPAKLMAQCKVGVHLTITGCGHNVTVDCSRASGVRKTPYSCPAVCGQPLECGHTCLAVCGTCQEFSVKKLDCINGSKIRTHLKCFATCNKQLSCGHPCNKPCHKDTLCGPCHRDCAVQCGHSSCPNKCSIPCAPCLEPCHWSGCPHNRLRCSQPCGAPCDRLPCDELCVKNLSCGHPCPTPCGEVCPDPKVACKRCAPPKQLESVVDLCSLSTMQEHDLKVDGPLIALQCGHVFSVSTLDMLTSMDEFYIRGNSSEVTGSCCQWVACRELPRRLQDVKSCPHCRSPLVGVRRYGRATNKALLDQMTKKFICFNQAKLRNMDLDKIIFEADKALEGAGEHPTRTLSRLRSVSSGLQILEKELKKLNSIPQPLQAIYDAVQVRRTRRNDDNESNVHTISRKAEFDAPDASIRFEGILALSHIRIAHMMAQFKMFNCELNHSGLVLPETYFGKAMNLSQEAESDLLSTLSLALASSRFRTAFKLRLALTDLLIRRIDCLGQAAYLIAKRLSRANSPLESRTYASKGDSFMLEISFENIDKIISLISTLHQDQSYAEESMISMASNLKLSLGQALETAMKALFFRLVGFGPPSVKDDGLASTVRGIFNRAKTLLFSTAADKLSPAIRPVLILQLAYEMIRWQNIVFAQDEIHEFLDRCSPHINISSARLLVGQAGQVSLDEKRMIFEAMGFTRNSGNPGMGNHWYACPNGHVYVIGGCGGAMETSKCPECDAVIGGQSHTLVGGNRAATEFLAESRPHRPSGG